MPKVLWTPVAESDLDDILFYIGYVDRNPVTADRIYREICDRVEAHARNVFPGHRHLDAPAGWLYIRHKRWLIFYKPHPDGIEVMRVIDSVRDLPRRLRDR